MPDQVTADTLVYTDKDEVIRNGSLYGYDLYITIDWWRVLSQGRDSIYPLYILTF
jgi:hypothetical protein